MSNSKLVVHTNISPNRSSPRNHKIDTISIHCVVGQVTAESLGNIFKPSSKGASSNYGVDKDGRVGMYVEEKDRSWCTSSASNDNRAITIEVASDTKHPYKVTDKAYNALIELVADICKRNGITKLVWSTNKSDRINRVNGCNMAVHRDYANKSCPGDYLYGLHSDIAKQVNAKINSSEVEEKETTTQTTKEEVYSESVKGVQQWLNDKFKTKIDEDNIYGPLTKKAIVKALQTQLNLLYNTRLSVDGIFGNLTKSQVRNLKIGSSGDYVQILQSALICNKRKTGGYDGIFGNQTEQAVKDFQAINKIVVDGIAGKSTFERLLK